MFKYKQQKDQFMTPTTTATTTRAPQGSAFNAPSCAFIPRPFSTTQQREPAASSQNQTARALAATAPAKSSLPSECFYG